jgi:hypothetical protein
MTAPGTRAYGTMVMDPAGANLQKTVRWVSIHQAEKMHDLAVVTVRGEDSSQPEYTTGTPVHIQYGWLGVQVEDFYGYVNHCRPRRSKDSRNEGIVLMDVVCVAASYVFKSEFSQVFQNTQASTVISAIAQAQMFSCTASTGDPTWPTLSCVGQSGWEFMVYMADKNGWTVWANKTNINFTTAELALESTASQTPVFFTNTASQRAGQESITFFQSLQGDTVDLAGHTKANRTLSGLNLATGQQYQVSNADVLPYATLGATNNAPFFARQETDIVSSDQALATQQLFALTQRNRFFVQAVARVSGDIQVTQASTIVLEGLNKASAGVWYVEEVVHNIRYGLYTMDLVLGRDAIGDNGVRPTYPSFTAWDIADLNSLLAQNVPPTVLVANRWRASYGTPVGLGQ